jgi:hypothetical protein
VHRISHAAGSSSSRGAQGQQDMLAGLQ